MAKNNGKISAAMKELSRQGREIERERFAQALAPHGIVRLAVGGGHHTLPRLQEIGENQ